VSASASDIITSNKLNLNAHRDKLEMNLQQTTETAMESIEKQSPILERELLTQGQELENFRSRLAMSETVSAVTQTVIDEIRKEYNIGRENNEEEALAERDQITLNSDLDQDCDDGESSNDEKQKQADEEEEEEAAAAYSSSMTENENEPLVESDLDHHTELIAEVITNANAAFDDINERVLKRMAEKEQEEEEEEEAKSKSNIDTITTASIDQVIKTFAMESKSQIEKIMMIQDLNDEDIVEDENEDEQNINNTNNNKTNVIYDSTSDAGTAMSDKETFMMTNQSQMLTINEQKAGSIRKLSLSQTQLIEEDDDDDDEDEERVFEQEEIQEQHAALVDETENQSNLTSVVDVLSTTKSKLYQTFEEESSSSTESNLNSRVNYSLERKRSSTTTTTAAHSSKAKKSESLDLKTKIKHDDDDDESDSDNHDENGQGAAAYCSKFDEKEEVHEQDTIYFDATTKAVVPVEAIVSIPFNVVSCSSEGDDHETAAQAGSRVDEEGATKIVDEKLSVSKTTGISESREYLLDQEQHDDEDIELNEEKTKSKTCHDENANIGDASVTTVIDQQRDIEISYNTKHEEDDEEDRQQQQQTKLRSSSFEISSEGDGTHTGDEENRVELTEAGLVQRRRSTKHEIIMEAAIAEATTESVNLLDSEESSSDDGDDQKLALSSTQPFVSNPISSNSPQVSSLNDRKSSLFLELKANAPTTQQQREVVNTEDDDDDDDENEKLQLIKDDFHNSSDDGGGGGGGGGGNSSNFSCTTSEENFLAARNHHYTTNDNMETKSDAGGSILSVNDDDDDDDDVQLNESTVHIISRSLNNLSCLVVGSDNGKKKFNNHNTKDSIDSVSKLIEEEEQLLLLMKQHQNINEDKQKQHSSIKVSQSLDLRRQQESSQQQQTPTPTSKSNDFNYLASLDFMSVVDENSNSNNTNNNNTMPNSLSFLREYNLQQRRQMKQSDQEFEQEQQTPTPVENLPGGGDFFDKRVTSSNEPSIDSLVSASVNTITTNNNNNDIRSSLNEDDHIGERMIDQEFRENLVVERVCADLEESEITAAVATALLFTSALSTQSSDEIKSQIYKTQSYDMEEEEEYFVETKEKQKQTSCSEDEENVEANEIYEKVVVQDEEEELRTKDGVLLDETSYLICTPGSSSSSSSSRSSQTPHGEKETVVDKESSSTKPRLSLVQRLSQESDFVTMAVEKAVEIDKPLFELEYGIDIRKVINYAEINQGESGCDDSSDDVLLENLQDETAKIIESSDTDDLARELVQAVASKAVEILIKQEVKEKKTQISTPQSLSPKTPSPKTPRKISLASQIIKYGKVMDANEAAAAVAAAAKQKEQMVQLEKTDAIIDEKTQVEERSNDLVLTVVDQAQETEKECEKTSSSILNEKQESIDRLDLSNEIVSGIIVKALEVAEEAEKIIEVTETNVQTFEQSDQILIETKEENQISFEQHQQEPQSNLGSEQIGQIEKQTSIEAKETLSKELVTSTVTKALEIVLDDQKNDQPITVDEDLTKEKEEINQIVDDSDLEEKIKDSFEKIELPNELSGDENTFKVNLEEEKVKMENKLLEEYDVVDEKQFVKKEESFEKVDVLKDDFLLPSVNLNLTSEIIENEEKKFEKEDSYEKIDANEKPLDDNSNNIEIFETEKTSNNDQVLFDKQESIDRLELTREVISNTLVNAFEIYAAEQDQEKESMALENQEIFNLEKEPIVEKQISVDTLDLSKAIFLATVEKAIEMNSDESIANNYETIHTKGSNEVVSNTIDEALVLISSEKVDENIKETCGKLNVVDTDTTTTTTNDDQDEEETLNKENNSLAEIEPKIENIQEEIQEINFYKDNEPIDQQVVETESEEKMPLQEIERDVNLSENNLIYTDFVASDQSTFESTASKRDSISLKEQDSSFEDDLKQQQQQQQQQHHSEITPDITSDELSQETVRQRSLDEQELAQQLAELNVDEEKEDIDVTIEQKEINEAHQVAKVIVSEIITNVSDLYKDLASLSSSNHQCQHELIDDNENDGDEEGEDLEEKKKKKKKSPKDDHEELKKYKKDDDDDDDDNDYRDNDANKLQRDSSSKIVSSSATYHEPGVSIESSSTQQEAANNNEAVDEAEKTINNFDLTNLDQSKPLLTSSFMSEAGNLPGTEDSTASHCSFETANTTITKDDDDDDDDRLSNKTIFEENNKEVFTRSSSTTNDSYFTAVTSLNLNTNNAPSSSLSSSLSNRRKSSETNKSNSSSDEISKRILFSKRAYTVSVVSGGGGCDEVGSSSSNYMTARDDLHSYSHDNISHSDSFYSAVEDVNANNNNNNNSVSMSSASSNKNDEISSTYSDASNNNSSVGTAFASLNNSFCNVTGNDTDNDDDDDYNSDESDKSCLTAEKDISMGKFNVECFLKGMQPLLVQSNLPLESCDTLSHSTLTDEDGGNEEKVTTQIEAQPLENVEVLNTAEEKEEEAAAATTFCVPWSEEMTKVLQQQQQLQDVSNSSSPKLLKPQSESGSEDRASNTSSVLEFEKLEMQFSSSSSSSDENLGYDMVQHDLNTIYESEETPLVAIATVTTSETIKKQNDDEENVTVNFVTSSSSSSSSIIVKPDLNLNAIFFNKKKEPFTLAKVEEGKDHSAPSPSSPIDSSTSPHTHLQMSSTKKRLSLNTESDTKSIKSLSLSSSSSSSASNSSLKSNESFENELKCKYKIDERSFFAKIQKEKSSPPLPPTFEPIHIQSTALACKNHSPVVVSPCKITQSNSGQCSLSESMTSMSVLQSPEGNTSCSSNSARDINSDSFSDSLCSSIFGVSQLLPSSPGGGSGGGGNGNMIESPNSCISGDSLFPSRKKSFQSINAASVQQQTGRLSRASSSASSCSSTSINDSNRHSAAMTNPSTGSKSVFSAEDLPSFKKLTSPTTSALTVVSNSSSSSSSSSSHLRQHSTLTTNNSTSPAIPQSSSSSALLSSFSSSSSSSSSSNSNTDSKLPKKVIHSNPNLNAASSSSHSHHSSNCYCGKQQPSEQKTVNLNFNNNNNKHTDNLLASSTATFKFQAETTTANQQKKNETGKTPRD
jgi:hypothetical protein